MNIRSWLGILGSVLLGLSLYSVGGKDILIYVENVVHVPVTLKEQDCKSNRKGMWGKIDFSDFAGTGIEKCDLDLVSIFLIF